ncbi:RNA-binding protein [Schizosaccharomyces japonicus yFS275]|uniref:RNA-binding protein n=1 Tax=Schizosaccharomyces japonicus (strain yFS275 / FY16936) TaxID=402676 RepID=B6JXK3_SCHJY|nr:RNA-binding protein [Schizosaccharomyces japonicus yFS275]EEB05147.2 RNA-binding protein [Schizosaccharomyces japonicus yFS275]
MTANLPLSSLNKGLSSDSMPFADIDPMGPALPSSLLHSPMLPSEASSKPRMSLLSRPSSNSMNESSSAPSTITNPTTSCELNKDKDETLTKPVQPRSLLAASLEKSSSTMTAASSTTGAALRKQPEHSALLASLNQKLVSLNPLTSKAADAVSATVSTTSSWYPQDSVLSESPPISTADLSSSAARVSGEPFSILASNAATSAAAITNNLVGLKCAPNAAHDVTVPSFFDNSTVTSRYLIVSNLPRIVPCSSLIEIFSQFGDVKGIDTSALSTDGIIIVAFYDLRQSIQASKALRHRRFFNDRLLNCQFCSRATLQKMINQGAPIHFLDDNEGQLLITLQGSTSVTKEQMQGILQAFGSLISLKTLYTNGVAQVVCKYFDSRDASFAYEELDGRVIHNMCFRVSYYDPSVDSSSSSASLSSYSMKSLGAMPPSFDWSGSTGVSSTSRNTVTEMSFSPYASDAFPAYQSVPLGRTESSPAWGTQRLHRPLADRSNKFDYGASAFGAPKFGLESTSLGQPNAFRLRHLSNDWLNNISSRWNSIPQSLNERESENLASVGMKRSLTVDVGSARPNPSNLSFASLTLHDTNNNRPSFRDVSIPHSISNGSQCMERSASLDRNVVDYDRILQGLDTRTTIMIKNIPNKFTQQMLRDYIDVTNRNTYDFLYLRIDFVNKCNVGYAFINFIEPKSIVTFGKARVGTQWNVFHSEKICDISYANIQGKERLIEKFRNSCVMDENPAYRPKIFVSHGPNRGQEEPFPAPNNARRKLRSIASAQQIGLFPPTTSKC